jgi:hypothetical protein
MSMPESDTRVRPSAWWYVAVVVLWIASFVAFVIAIKPIISIFNAGVDQVRNNSTVVIPDDGRTIYSSIRPTGVTCTLTGNGSPVELKSFDQDASTSITFSFDDGTDVHPIASTPDDFPAGQYTLACDVPPRALLATGKRIDFGSFAAVLIVGIIGSIVLGIAGLIVLIVLLVKRHKSKQRVRQAQAAAAYGGYGGYSGYQQGGYPQGGYTQPTYPQNPQSGYPPPDDTPSDPTPTDAQLPYGTPPPPPPPPPPPGAADQPGSSDDAGPPPPPDRA